MQAPTLRLKACLCLLFIVAHFLAYPQAPPTGFASATVSTGWSEAVGITFSEDGLDMFVWERAGRVWVVRNNQKQLLLDISQEVGGWSDHGLLGFALHPHFDENGYFYLLYLVDRHHLKNFGTGAYNPSANEYANATIGRVTRYTATRAGNSYSVTPNSRKIMIGETISTGIPSLSISHTTGSLVFGTDHTLLISTGDGSSPNDEDMGSYAQSYFTTALADGIIQPRENVGAFRSQQLDGYNGKILRIDAETGAGLPSNPFYDPARPNSAKSKVWALGLRNPFRMSLKPGTGSHSEADGNPGILYVGDVGWDTWEEVNVVDKPGMNFGWPIFEGYASPSGVTYSTINIENQDAPNPLYQVNGCNRRYFYFQELLKQTTLSGTATFVNPCNPAENIPSNIQTFVHARPMIAWRHCCEPARVGTFTGQTASSAPVTPGASPVSGPQFMGRSSTGGVFYTGTDFPAPYQNSYFFGDYGTGWIRNLSVDGNDQPTSVRDFVNQNAIVVGFATHPTGEGLYYVNFPSEIRRVYYSNNRPPIAVASADKLFGPGPLTVQFAGNASTDFENQPLQYEWNFGDGTPLSTQANPSHIFTPPNAPTKYTVTLKVTDNLGVSNQASLIISANNTPPQVTITSPVDNDVYSITEQTVYNLRATVTDEEHSGNQLVYQWQYILHHEAHQHPNPIDNSVESTASFSPLGCDGQLYFYRVVLTVTDEAGASTTKEVKLYPDCGGTGTIAPIINWPTPLSISEGTALTATQLNATASYNGTAVPGTFTYTPPVGTILPSGVNQQLLVNFVPNESTLYKSVSRTNFINVIGEGVAFYRAINLNGSTAVIDGNNWESSSNAPGFSFTNGIAFSNQAVTLQPATDATRANMIRSSLYGNNIGLAVGSVPAGNYLVYLYVWEDNSPEVFSVSIEGTVVRANYNSGPTGTWNKLGPFAVSVADGTMNILASGGAANLSGLEIWSQGTTQQGPLVSNPIPNQVATIGIPYSFTFPANTFTGTNLTYAATLSDGNILPAWLSFNPGTRTFSGTPLPGNVGTVEVRVNANGTGGSVNDLFNLTVSAPGTQTFYRAINVNGAALVIDNNNWEASASAAGFSVTNSQAFANQGVILQPATDATRTTMIRSSLYGNNIGLALANVPAGSYQVYLYVWEDNNPEVYSVSLEGVVVRANYNSGAAGTWAKLGPFPINLTDGTINVSATGGAANFSGLEIWRAGTGNQPPVLSNPIADQLASAGTAFSFIFPLNTFSGSVLTYTAALSNGSALPPWLTFNPATRSFAGTPAAANTGTFEVRVTASDGNGTSANDLFNVTVSLPAAPTVFNPIVDQQSTVGVAFSFAFPVNTFTGTGLTYTAASPNGDVLPAWLTFTPVTRTFGGTPAAGNTGAFEIRVTATDANGNSANDLFNVTVSLPPAPTVTTPIADQQATVGVPYNFTFAASTFTGTGLTYMAALSNGDALPSWLIFTPATRTFGGTPAAGSTGTFEIRLTATDANSNSANDLFNITVGLPQAPTVFSPVADQQSTVGLAYSFTFAANTFSGTALTYTAALSNGNVLPAWLTFTPATRTFSGTPGAGNTGTFEIQLTATDGNASSASDLFNLTVNAQAALTFYRAINLNGASLTIDNNSWQASTTAPGFSAVNATGFSNQGVNLQPATDANRATMIRSSLYGSNIGIAVGAVPTGTYQVYLYVWEDNNPEVFSVSLEGIVVRANYNSGTAGSWSKLGPFPANITDGTINISATGGAANFSGLEIWRQTVGNPPPILSNPIADQFATVGTAYSFAFPANTFTDINGGALTYSATLSNGTPLPAWLIFNSGTRTFSGTPVAGTTGMMEIRINATGSGGVASDLFNLTVSAPGSQTFYRGINLNGPALLIDNNNWEASASATGFSFTNGIAFSNQAVALQPVTDVTRANMIRSSLYGNNIGISLGAVPAGSYAVYLYVWEDNNAQVFSVSLEGSVVRANYNSGSAGTWTKLGPFPVTLTDGIINVLATGGAANLSGLEVWTINNTGGGNGARVAGNSETSEQLGTQASPFTQITAYPNPFSEKVNITFTTEESAATKLVLFDNRGVTVRMLYEGNSVAGKTESLEVESGNLPNGVYVIQLIHGNHIRHLRIALLR